MCKRMLSLALVLVLLLGLVAVPRAHAGGSLAGRNGQKGPGLPLQAAEQPGNLPAAQVEVELQAQAENGFLLAPQMVTVTGDLAESYGYTDQVTYCDGVSALDVLVRAHELIFGGDFTLETAQALLMVGDSGTITKLFGVETGNCGFTINELIPTGDEASPWGGYTAYTLNEAVVTGGDQVSFFLYQDDWVSDLYTWYVQDGTVTRELQAEAKLPMDITVNGYLIGWTGYMYKTFDEIVADVNNTMAVSDAQIALVDLDSGAITDIAGAVTDEDGRVALTFPEAGVYAITAYVPAQAQAERYATPAIMTLATVTVSEHTHRWSDWQVETQPSCTQDGVQTRHCPCGETEQAAISATGHRLADTVVAPSCTEKGYTLHTCTLCGYHYTSNEVEAQGHSWGQWVLTQPGSCFHPGVETRTCSACQATEIREAGLNPDNCPSKAFADLNTNAWYHEGVDFALNQGLMNGVGNYRFAPNHRMTRAMVVMVLYRLAGAPEVTGTVEFTDVPEDQYYYEALVWATKAGLAKGVTETTFAPGNAITREQLVTFLYRYAQYAGMDVGGQADMDAFADKDKVSGYAAEAVAWAVAGGIINGMENNTLAPRANATRGQVATMLMRLTQL
ncbi:MAG TPA: S-layer homology domain-containing protein [Candidatus Faecousia faecigallinarum]|nr:S-layer homology domain-containing protein [Candidatus Faecousia faecigallinarum]